MSFQQVDVPPSPRPGPPRTHPHDPERRRQSGDGPDLEPSVHRSRWWVWLIVLVLLAVGGYFLGPRVISFLKGQGKPAAARGGGPVPVVVATARRGNMDIYLNGLGTVVPLNTV